MTDGPQRDVSWEDLARQLDELGTAVARAVRAAVDDPENRKRAADLRDEFADVARKVGTAFDEALASDEGRRIRDDVADAASKVAAAGRRAAEEVRPHLADVARTATETLRDAAAVMERRAAEQRAAQTSDETPEGRGADDETPEPGAPTSTG